MKVEVSAWLAATAVVAGLGLGAKVATAGKRACPGGRFLVQSPGLIAREGAPGMESVTEAVVVAGSRVSISTGCQQRRAHVKAGKRFTRVRARWRSCGGGLRKVRLKGRIDAATCNVMTGVLKTRRPRGRSRFTAVRSVCGDGFVDIPGGEECEPPGVGVCDSACRLQTTCGDGVVEWPEECDDGNRGAGDGCGSACAVEAGFACNGQPSLCAPVCGDGRVRGGEECDDGNLADGDCCSARCRIEPAGTVCRPSGGACDLAERCDGLAPACPPDAIASDGTVCTDGDPCTTEDRCLGGRCGGGGSTCGDGVVQPVCGEQCDGGAANADIPNAACRTNCTARRCGDGIVDDAAGEECDDGNGVPDDACDVSCRRNGGGGLPVFGCDEALIVVATVHPATFRSRRGLRPPAVDAWRVTGEFALVPTSSFDPASQEVTVTFSQREVSYQAVLPVGAFVQRGTARRPRWVFGLRRGQAEPPGAEGWRKGKFNQGLPGVVGPINLVRYTLSGAGTIFGIDRQFSPGSFASPVLRVTIRAGDVCATVVSTCTEGRGGKLLKCLSEPLSSPSGAFVHMRPSIIG